MSSNSVASILFWMSVGTVLYTYVGYPLLLGIMSRLRTRPVKQAHWIPSVSIIITAYNEERDLPEKLENTLALDYPPDKLEIIVASDGSTDRTDQIAHEFGARGVRLHRQLERLGKTAAQNAAVDRSHGEIILFSDATTLYRPDVLRRIVPNFADPAVGCVAGRLVYHDPVGSNIGHGARSYWSYETFLKKHESRLSSLIGVSGCLYAVRRTAYVPLYHEACSDFIIASKMVEQGLRAVYEPDAICVEKTNQCTHKEFRMRVRIITQTLGDLWCHRRMLNPLQTGFYAVQLLSHKVLRYLVPFFVLSTLVSSVVLVPTGGIYFSVLVAYACFFGAAGAAWLGERLGVHSPLLALPQYFLLVNLASLVAVFKFLSGERYARWEPIREPLAASAARRAA